METFGPFFGVSGELVFDGVDRTGVPLVYDVREDGSGLQKLIAKPGVFAFGNSSSPDGRWIAAQDSAAWGSLFVFPTNGGPPTLVCKGCSWPQGTDPVPPPMSWSPDG